MVGSEGIEIPGADSTTQTVPAPQRILVADDEHLVAEVISKSLTTLGYEVVGPVTDGEQAVDLARREQPDMAILDIRMPKVDGLAAAQALSNEMDLAVLMVTAYSDESYLRDSCQIGVHGYVLKPTSTEQLRVAIAMAWTRFQQQRGLSMEVTRLQTSLERRKVIEQAKWILVEKCGLSEADAHRRLQKQARDRRKTMAEVAASILESHTLFAEEGALGEAD
jgi:two-component system, response regulator PdtaR